MQEPYDNFTRGYLVCALWTATGEAGVPLDTTYGVDDFSAGTVQAARVECAQFQVDNAAELAVAYTRYAPLSDGCTPQDRAGHDFWLTRNHHGAGFWDRELGAVGDVLTRAAHAWGELDVYVGDDEFLYMEG